MTDEKLKEHLVIDVLKATHNGEAVSGEVYKDAFLAAVGLLHQDSERLNAVLNDARSLFSAAVEKKQREHMSIDAKLDALLTEHGSAETLSYLSDFLLKTLVLHCKRSDKVTIETSLGTVAIAPKTASTTE